MVYCSVETILIPYNITVQYMNTYFHNEHIGSGQPLHFPDGAEHVMSMTPILINGLGGANQFCTFLNTIRSHKIAKCIDSNTVVDEGQ